MTVGRSDNGIEIIERLKSNMKVNNCESFALLDYMIVTNEEMHSYQIRYLNEFLVKEGLNDYKDVIFDVIHDLDEKTSYQIYTAYNGAATKRRSTHIG